MNFVMYLDNERLPVVINVGSVSHAGDLVAEGARRGRVRGDLLAAEGRMLALPRSVSIPFGTVRRVELQPL